MMMVFGAVANPTYMDTYDYWQEEYNKLDASGLCGPELWCNEVSSQSECSDSDYCYLDGEFTTNGEGLCCYADMGKASKSCFDVYGYENADALIYYESTKKIVGGTMYSDASVGDTNWGYWEIISGGLRKWYTYDFYTEACDIDTSSATFHSYHCQVGYWTDEELVDEENMCWKCPTSNVQTCNQDTVKCKNGYYAQISGGNVLCNQCPEVDMDSTSGCGDKGDSSGGFSITSCYANNTDEYCDYTGTFEFNNNCYYTR